MAIYSVTTSNWNSPAFWSGINQGVSGHTLDFSALGGGFTVNYDTDTNSVTISDGAASFVIGDQDFAGTADATLGGTTIWDYFTTLVFAGGGHYIAAGFNGEIITTGAGHDTIYANGGADSIEAGDGNNVVYGGSGNDTVVSGAGTDQIYGGDGDDSLLSGDGTDTVLGGAGNDTIRNGAGDDSLVGGTGDDLIVASAGNDTLEGGDGNDTLDGGIDNDSMSGGADSDTFVINDAFGQDTIYGGETATSGIDLDTIDLSAVTTSVTVGFNGGEFGTIQNDVGPDSIAFFEIESLILTDQADSVSGGGGNEVIDGRGGNDTIETGTGDDSIRGGAGDDRLVGGDGNDTVEGGAGNDYVAAFTGDDSLSGGDGNDEIFSLGGGNDTLDGGADADLISVMTMSNALVTGGEAVTSGLDRDTLNAGTGVDMTLTVTGAESGTITDGTDTITYSEIEEVRLGSGNDTVEVGTETAALYIDAGGGDDLFNAASGTGNSTFEGQSGNDTIYGGSGNETLGGGSGNDQIFGGAGDDSIRSGGDADTVQGGLGNDTIDGAQDNDSLDGGDGNDLIFGGDGADTLIGGDGVDTLAGGGDADVFVLADGTGNDSISGGETTTSGTDSDTIDGSAITTNMVATFGGSEFGTITAGADTITFSEIENIFAGSGNDTLDASLDTSGVGLFGNGGADSILGGSGADFIDGGDGADTVNAGDGDDTINFGSGDDSGTGAAGDDSLDGGDGNDTLTGGAGNDTLVGGLGDDSLFGATQADTLLGGDGNDTLDGGLGTDSLVAGDGNDSVVGGEGGDTLLGQTGDDTLTGGDGADVLRGGLGNDLISDDAGDDTVLGGEGDDTLLLGAGNDSLEGLEDSDLFVVSDGFGNDTVLGGDTFTTGVNYDTIDLTALSNPVSVVFTGPGAGTITDSITGDTITFSGIEQLILTAGDDTVDASLDAGYTYIQTRDGNDYVQGSAGDDVYDDQIWGPNGQGNDTFIGGDGADEVWAGTDDDSISGGLGSDTLSGQSGNDTIDGGDGNDSLYGGLGDDSVLGGLGDDLIQENGPSGGAVNDGDTATGSTSADGFVFAGTAGTSATIILDDDAGTANDGDGEYDAVYVTSTGDGASLTLEGFEHGVDRIIVSEKWAGLSSTEIAPGHHQIVLSYANGNSQTFDVFHDNASVFDPAQTFFTYADEDTLVGGGGNDTILAGAGADSIDGGAGNDSLVGGDGDDTFALSDSFGNDTITGGEGGETLGDRLDLSATTWGMSWDLTSADGEAGTVTDSLDTVSFTQIETIVLGDGDDTLRLADGSGARVVEGFEAPLDDGFGGHVGQDVLDVSGLTSDGGTTPVTVSDVTVTDVGGNAVLSFPGGESITLVGVTVAQVGDPTQLIAMGIPADASDFTVSGDAGDNLIDGSYTGDDQLDMIDNLDGVGGTNNDSVLAGDGADTVLAGLGNDTVEGGAGNDSLSGGADNDIVLGGTGDDWLSGDSGNDTLDGGDGADSVFGAEGDDSMLGGAGNDSIEGWIGNDTLDGGADNDYLDGADGNDLLLGGTGNDTLLGGNNGGQDTLEGGAGDDSMLGGDGSDRLLGGTGADTIDAGAGNDTVVIEDGFGSDLIVGGETGETTGDVLDLSAVTQDVTVDLTAGNPANPEDGVVISGADTITFSEFEALQFGTGNDTLIGSTAADNLDLGGGNDSGLGGLGDDTLDGGDGNDFLSGGDGADSLIGSAGADTLVGGAGADTLDGGAGNDLFNLGSGDIAAGGDGDDAFNVGPGDLTGAALTITGGEGGEAAGDTLNITGPATINMTGAESGTVTWLDGSVLTFSEIENITYTACFTANTRITTLRGEIRAIDIRPGDKVLTRDNGYQTVRWAGSTFLSAEDLKARPELAPVRIAAGALDGVHPTRPSLLSPQHRVLLESLHAELMFGESEVLAAAAHLTGRKGIRKVLPEQGVTYVHFMFDRHELVLSDGTWTESFQPGEQTLAGLDQDQRAEIFALFPELETQGATEMFSGARMSLRRYQTEVLIRAA